jgi:hypothetical protein
MIRYDIKKERKETQEIIWRNKENKIKKQVS